MLWNEYPSTADYSYVNPEQAIGGHQETNPDVCVAGPVSTPPVHWDRGFQAVPTIVILFQ